MEGLAPGEPRTPNAMLNSTSEFGSFSTESTEITVREGT